MCDNTGQVSTYQMGAVMPWGSSYKITPETTEEELNVMKCFLLNGTKDDPVTPQGALPDLQGFQVGGVGVGNYVFSVLHVGVPIIIIILEMN